MSIRKFISQATTTYRPILFTSQRLFVCTNDLYRISHTNRRHSNAYTSHNRQYSSGRHHSRLDGIILIGGADIHPSYYNEEPIEQLGEVDSLRDVYDISLIRLAAQRGVPMLGICRGEQLINVAFGGTLYQDIPAQHPDTTVRHNQEEPSSVPTHAVNLLPDSEMARITGETQLFTNTHHHQAVKQVAPGFRITAWATDSIPEAIENIEGKTIWGVQFHPEALTVAGDSISARFFYFLVDQAIAFRQSK